jgi:DNA-binding MarR family transcriptional regulator
MAIGFSGIERDAWGGFLATYSRVIRVIEADLTETSRITHVEFEVLLRLWSQPGHRLRMQDLAAQSLLTRSGVSRAVERLERAGLVRREGAREDRRGAWAVLTDAGSTRFRAAADSHIPLVRRVFLDLFTPDELKAMAAGWQRVEQHLEQGQSTSAGPVRD